MDIYFCDLCGVRVTDIDLKGGHGLRSGHDVICPTCLELGHGKDWLAKRQSQLKPVPSTSPAPAKRLPESRPAAATMLDRARDRARTAEDDHTPAVAVQVLTADADGEDVLSHDGPSELEQESGPHALLKPVENHSTNLAAAASSFSALSATPSSASTDAAQHRDDLDDPLPAGDDNEATAQVRVTPDRETDAESESGTHAEGESPFSFKNPGQTGGEEDSEPTEQSGGDVDADRKVNAKDETLPSERPPVKPDTKTPANPTSPTKRSSTKTAKAKTGKLSGRTRAKKASNLPVIIISCVTLPLLLIMIYLQFIRAPGTKGPRKVQIINISDVLKKSITEARLDATLAMNASPQKADQLAAAKDKIQGVLANITSYESEALKAGMTEEDIGRALEAANWPNTYSLIKMLNEARVKMSDH
jgi:hypothetical protein